MYTDSSVDACSHYRYMVHKGEGHDALVAVTVETFPKYKSKYHALKGEILS